MLLINLGGSFKMSGFSPSNLVIVLAVLLNFVAFGNTSPQRGPPFPPARAQQQLARNRVAPLVCTQDSLMFYQDCRMCVCPRPNRVAKCYRKSCDLRTKDTGQCPSAVLRMHDSKSCPLTLVSGCKVDVDCPGPLLCCFDFCGGTKCINPVPLDQLTGQPHKGRGYGFS